MRHRAIACVLVSSLLIARAAPAAPGAPASRALAPPSEAELHARSLKHRGAWVLGVGVPHLAVALGGVFWSVAIDAQDRRCAQIPGCMGAEFAPPWLWLGVPFGIIGVVLTAVGLPLFLVGQARGPAAPPPRRGRHRRPVLAAAFCRSLSRVAGRARLARCKP